MAQTQTRQNARWDFTGDVVLITGAAQGMGRSHALGFAAAGADLVLCDIERSQASLGNVVAECEQLGAKVLATSCDVRDGRQVRQMVNDGVDRFHKIDVLVNNAGIERHNLVADFDEQEWDDVIDTNLKGVFLCSKYVADHMKKAGRGSIISIGSIASTVGVLGNAHYCASKHGVAGFSKALALELAPSRITVNYVCPTGVKTPMSDAVHSEEAVRWIHELSRISGSWNLIEEDTPLDPAEITSAVMWLASDSARFVTGTSIVVDAGYTAK